MALEDFFKYLAVVVILSIVIWLMQFVFTKPLIGVLFQCHINDRVVVENGPAYASEDARKCMLYREWFPFLVGAGLQFRRFCFASLGFAVLSGIVGIWWWRQPLRLLSAFLAAIFFVGFWYGDHAEKVLWESDFHRQMSYPGGMLSGADLKWKWNIRLKR